MALYAFDGTWMTGSLRAREVTDKGLQRRWQERLTNVAEFARMYAQEVPREPARVPSFDSRYVSFVSGVGSRRGTRAVGGLAGVGARRRLRKQYHALIDRYANAEAARPGFDANALHRIDIVGFSRGAATAIHFANVIHKLGVRDARPGSSRYRGWKRVEGLGWTYRFPMEQLPGHADPPIRFLGLFDAVATFGQPVKPNRGIRFWMVDSIPPNVRTCAHALALDDQRSQFAPVRPRPMRTDVTRILREGETLDRLAEEYGVDVDQIRRVRRHGDRDAVGVGDTVRLPGTHLEEVWFRGEHANIGGSFPTDRGLSDIVLFWMIDKAIDCWWESPYVDRPYGLQKAVEKFDGKYKIVEAYMTTTYPDFDMSSLSVSLRPDPNGEIARKRVFGRRANRSLGRSPRIHHSALSRSTNRPSDFLRNRPLLRPLPPDMSVAGDPPILDDRRS